MPFIGYYTARTSDAYLYSKPAPAPLQLATLLNYVFNYSANCLDSSISLDSSSSIG